jgi:hypothetical protein
LKVTIVERWEAELKVAIVERWESDLRVAIVERWEADQRVAIVEVWEADVKVAIVERWEIGGAGYSGGATGGHYSSPQTVQQTISSVTFGVLLMAGVPWLVISAWLLEIQRTGRQYWPTLRIVAAIWVVSALVVSTIFRSRNSKGSPRV